jgi:hypothetical protein
MFEIYVITHEMFVSANSDQTARIISDNTEVMERSPMDDGDDLLAVPNLLLYSPPAPYVLYS